MKNLKVLLTVALAVMISVSAVMAVSMSVDELKQLTQTETFGAFPGPEIYQDLTVHGSVKSQEAVTPISNTGATTTLTLTASDSGTVYALSGSSSIITLPTVQNGLKFGFKINGAIALGNYVVDSSEGDNIEGTLIVAGAVVDCDAEDQINFIGDGENIGDYFEIVSDGTQWLLGDSGVLTAGKLTCTDPS